MNCIKISIQDENSRCHFIEVEIGLAEFAQALTGLGSTPVKMEVRNLECVGLVREREGARVVISNNRIQELGFNKHKRFDLEKLLADHYQREGWILNNYLGSQDSISFNGETVILDFSYHRFVEKPEAAETVVQKN